MSNRKADRNTNNSLYIWTKGQIKKRERVRERESGSEKERERGERERGKEREGMKTKGRQILLISTVVATPYSYSGIGG